MPLTEGLVTTTLRGASEPRLTVAAGRRLNPSADHVVILDPAEDAALAVESLGKTFVSIECHAVVV